MDFLAAVLVMLAAFVAVGALVVGVLVRVLGLFLFGCLLTVYLLL